MIQAIVVFIASALISFVGSLQLGPVNLSVIDTALTRSYKQARLLAIGGIIPEFIYATLAIVLGDVFKTNFYFALIFKCIVCLVLFWLAYTHYKKPVLNESQLFNTKLPPQKHNSLFFKGFFLAVFNAQLLPFWVYIQLLFNSIIFLQINGIIQKIAFVLGAGIGAYCLLMFFIFLINKSKNYVVNIVTYPYYNKLLALLFFTIAILQLALFWK